MNKTTFKNGHETWNKGMIQPYQEKLAKINKMKEARDEIVRLYLEKEQSGEIIAKGYGVTNATILRWLGKWGVKKRVGGEGMSGKRNPSWRGGQFISQGYVYIYAPNHHRATSGNGTYVRKHILIWEETNKRRLPKGHIIHHLNGIKTDNRPENLIAMKRGKHMNLAEPYKERIQKLEKEIVTLKARLGEAT